MVSYEMENRKKNILIPLFWANLRVNIRSGDPNQLRIIGPSNGRVNEPEVRKGCFGALEIGTGLRGQDS